MGTVIIIVDTVAVVVLSILLCRSRLREKTLTWWVGILEESARSNTIRNNGSAELVQKQEQPTD